MTAVGKPLHGLQVLDFSRLIPGPYCTMLLANLGAQVVKIEDTTSGDGMRDFGPFVDGVSTNFLALNRGKQSVAINLKHSAGQSIAQDLAEQCDVVVEGFRPGVATRLGIDFETLSRLNPRLVYCSISGFGQTGPLRDLTGHDLTYSAISGLLDALSPRHPVVPGLPLADAAGSLLATVRILAALHQRSNGAQYLDISLVDGAQALMPLNIAENLASSITGDTLLQTLRGSERNNLYCCSDGLWLAVCPLEEPFWKQCGRVLQDVGAIDGNCPLTLDVLRTALKQRARDEWFHLLSEAGVPCAPVRSYPEALHGARLPMTSPLLDTDDAPECSDRAPMLGEHTWAQLQMLGYSEQRINDLLTGGVVLIARS